MRPEEVAHYLQSNPQFFEAYADLVSQIVIPHPHGGRAISITERQMLALRDRNRELEAKLSELIQFGEENDAIGDKMHRLTVALAGAETLPVVLDLLHTHLSEDFTVPHISLCLWDAPSNTAVLPAYVRIDDAPAVLAENLLRPYCGGIEGMDPAVFFGGLAGIASEALMVLRSGEESFAVLSLGSEDPERFYPDMGALYLERLGELVSAALCRTLPR